MRLTDCLYLRVVRLVWWQLESNTEKVTSMSPGQSTLTNK